MNHSLNAELLRLGDLDDATTNDLEQLRNNLTRRADGISGADTFLR